MKPLIYAWPLSAKGGLWFLALGPAYSLPHALLAPGQVQGCCYFWDITYCLVDFPNSAHAFIKNSVIKFTSERAFFVLRRL